MRLRPIVWINAALVFPAVLSVYAGIRNSLSRSQDFQWSGAHLALQHVDPYSQFLRHDPEHSIQLSQVPNYLHELYILLLPLGSLSFSHAKPLWAILNCLFAILIALILRRIYDLPHSQALLLLLLLFAGTPFRIVLGNGQQSLLELLLFCLIFYFARPTGQGIALGLSYSKYSFSPVVFFYLFFCRRFRVLAISLALPLLGLLAMGLLVHGSLLTLSTEPLAVSRTDTINGLGNLMTIIQIACRNVLSVPLTQKIMAAAALLASVAFTFALARQQEIYPRRDAAALAVATLMFFPHRTYDYVFLAIPLAAALATPLLRTKAYILTTVALLWFGIKLIPTSLPPGMQLIEQMTVFLLLSGILMLVSRNILALQPNTADSCSRDNLVEIV
ncbi:MAG TPA: glycosyltransferase 87 family protein [Edaphobacter sp.]|nr:glycosyltransferase 87 family protein [Edaphobacter sp.]